MLLTTIALASLAQFQSAAPTYIPHSSPSGPSQISHYDDHGCGLHLQESEREMVLAVEDARVAGPSALQVDGVTRAISMTFHVVRRDNGSGGLSQARLDQAIIDCNAAFADAGMVFYQDGATDYINSDAYYFNINTMAEINALRSINNQPNSIDIYFTPNLAYESGGLCGISAFTFSSSQGIAMKNDCTALPDNASTFPHEVGHYFDLFHTHEPFFGSECVSGNNCGIAGDLVCDTPADPQLGNSNVNTFCQYTGNAQGPCNGDGAYAPDVMNLMSYSRKSCRDNFSQGQCDRAVQTLLDSRPDYVYGCVGDITLDGAVAVGDILLVIDTWGECSMPCLADVDGDGISGVTDLLAVLENWGACE